MEILLFLDLVTSSSWLSRYSTDCYQRLVGHGHRAHGGREGHEHGEEESSHGDEDLGTTV